MNLNRLLTRHASGEFAEVQDGKVLREGQTLTCAHCGRVWEVQPGSGRPRGWCWKCHAPTCGAPGCTICLPRAQQIITVEQRLDLWRKMEDWRG